MQLKLEVYVNMKLKRNSVALAAVCCVWGHVPQAPCMFIMDPFQPGSRDHTVLTDRKCPTPMTCTTCGHNATSHIIIIHHPFKFIGLSCPMSCLILPTQQLMLISQVTPQLLRRLLASCGPRLPYSDPHAVVAFEPKACYL